MFIGTILGGSQSPATEKIKKASFRCGELLRTSSTLSENRGSPNLLQALAGTYFLNAGYEMAQ